MRRDMAQFHRDTAWPPIPPEAMVRAGRMSSVPKAAPVPHHPASDAALEAVESDDQGGWRFDKTTGCTHTDSRGTPWSSY